MIINLKIFLFIMLSFSSLVNGLEIEEKTLDVILDKIIKEYSLKPLPVKPFEETEKYKLGKALFYDPILSGNRDVSCATCHLVELGSGDGKSHSLGTGSRGIGPHREVINKDKPIQGRNSPGLWNRDNNAFLSMFWDGRIEVSSNSTNKYQTNLDKELPEGFENLMAAQAIFPMIRHDEMLGQRNDVSSNVLPEEHANKINELAKNTNNLVGQEKKLEILDLVTKRVLGQANPNSYQKKYRELFQKAYPNTILEELNITHIANALSHFQETAFATRDMRWSRYLEGNKEILSEDEKKGAVLFYGRARCAVCHNGPVFSDFKYYSLGVPNYGPGMYGDGKDLGRYYVTQNPKDIYKFKTPSLINATITGPYYHNGSEQSLVEVIKKHINPLHKADHYKEDGKFLMDAEIVESISEIIIRGVKITEKEIDYLIAFLNTLEDDAKKYWDKIIPNEVPSKLKIFKMSLSNDK